MPVTSNSAKAESEVSLKNAGGWLRFVDSPKEVSKRLSQFGALPRSMPYIVYLKLETRGVATKFRLGGRIPTEGRRIQVGQNHLPGGSKPPTPKF